METGKIIFLHFGQSVFLARLVRALKVSLNIKSLKIF